MIKPLKIVKDTDPLIRNQSSEVTLPLNKEDEETILNMYEYLKATHDEKYRTEHEDVREGIGLAAPQIGILKKMIVVDYNDGEKQITHVLVNPVITSSSAKKCYLSRGEGCLSVDATHEGKILRSYKIRVKAYDALKKKDEEIIAIGLEAIVLQHEIDHLFGVLYYDHINPLNPLFAPEDAIAI